jgi:hypothetical protein
VRTDGRMHEWRISKYDPARRDRSGAHTGEDWTSWADVGRSFEGVVLTLGEYLRTEDRYVAAALALFRASGVPSVRVEDLEADRPVPPCAEELGLTALADGGPPLRPGMRLGEDALARALRLVLRELVWCRLESPGRFFLHVGHDLLLYAGSHAELPHALEQVRRLGLHVEARESPHRTLR